MSTQIFSALNMVPGNCPVDCEKNEFSGKIIHEMDLEDEAKFKIQWKFDHWGLIHEEYLVISFNDLIGTVGGTLGMFVGFSFISFIYEFIDFILNILRQ